MRWQRVARIVVAAVGISTAAAVYFLTRERTPQEPPALVSEADPAAKMQSGAGKDLRYKGDELLGTVTYTSVRSYENNRVVWEKFQYRLPDGTRLSADRVETRGNSLGGGKPDEMSLKGRVRLETKDGTELRAESGTYSEVTGIAKVPGKAAFTRGRLSGTGDGGTWERQTGIIKLLAHARVNIAPETDGEDPVRASASTMTYTADAKSMLFEEDARLERSKDTLRGDRATLHLSDDEERIRLIELRGHARVEPLKGQTSDLPEMRADDIDLGFYDGSQALQQSRLQGSAVMHQPSGEGRRSIEADRIDFTTAPDGTTLTRLDAAPSESKGRVTVRLPAAKDAPARRITGGTLASKGDDKHGLTSAVFEGGAEFEETANGRGASASKRVAKSRTLRLVIKGQLDAIEEARFDQAVEITDGDLRGWGDIGVYRASSGEMDLQPNKQTPGRKARVADNEAGITVEAVDLITAYLDSGSLYARGDVTTASTGSKAGRSSNTTSIFNDRDPIYGTLAAEFRYDDAAAKATYVGKGASRPRLQQGNNVVHGDYIEYFSERQDLTAKGHVDSQFDIAPSAADGKNPKTATGSYHATAETLVYTEKTRTAKYAGAVSLVSTDGTTTADAMDLLLAKDARTLDRLEAIGRVHAVLQKEREARGDRLVYEAREDLYHLWGKPLTLTNKENDGTCYAQDGSMVRFRGELGAPDFPADQNAAGGAPRRSIPCPATTAK
jgi:lipopolysaccharide export system protein LptA